MSTRGRAARVDTYVGPGAFRAKDAAKAAKARQDSDLPPRCAHCRRSWNTVVINLAVHCAEHTIECDGTCGRYDDEQ